MPAMTTVKIDAAGRWLRADAAASYKRMIAAGMPAGGIVSTGAGRTRAAQLLLYALWRAGRGNLAAYRSLHELGAALDVTRKSPAQLWMVHGSDPMRVTRTGTTRAAAYGWTRSVPSEAWHFSYNSAHDDHRHDPVKPPVVTVPPVVIPSPVPVGEIRLRVAEINCLSTRFSRTFTRRRSNLVKVMKSAAADVYLVNECAEPMRDYICSHLPGGAARWLVRRRGEQAIIFDGQKYDSPRDGWFPVDFTDYHGGVVAELIDKATKRAIAFGSYHLPPNSLVSLLKQQGYFHKFLKAIPSGLAILGGDGVNDESWGGVPWRSVRRSAANSNSRDMPTYKTSVTDHLWSGSRIQWRGYSVKPTRSSSDHNLIVGAATILAPIVVPPN